MSIIDHIKALPKDLPLNHAIMHVERITVDDLIALAESHERLLELARDATRTGDGIAGWSRTHQDLEKAIVEAEKL